MYIEKHTNLYAFGIYGSLSSVRRRGREGSSGSQGRPHPMSKFFFVGFSFNEGAGMPERRGNAGLRHRRFGRTARFPRKAGNVGEPVEVLRKK